MTEVSDTIKTLAGGWTVATGRRKSSVARVRVRPGDGKFEVNGRPLKQFFTTMPTMQTVLGPFDATKTADKFDVSVTVSGGGPTGQAGAIALGIGRILKMLESSLEPILRESGFLTRDSRMKERKKYGQRGARRRFQFSKR